MAIGAETRGRKTGKGNEIETARIRMMSWSNGMTKKERIQNDVIRRMLKTTKLHKQLQEKPYMAWLHQLKKRAITKSVFCWQGMGRGSLEG